MASRTIALLAVAVLIVGSIGYLQSKKVSVDAAAIAENAEIVVPELTTPEKAKKYERARELTQPAGFVNTEPFQLADYIGKKVILLDIWTYSCINCQRTLPYITSWNEKYRDQGLLVVGVHTPEFEFEKDIENVRKAAERFGVEYPVVLDNDYGTWHAYGNRYWPRKYLIDIDGYVVYDHIGEGGYAETENLIKQLLTERAEKLGESVDLSQEVTQVDVPEAITDAAPRSPEVYFGAWRNGTFGNGNPGVLGGFTLSAPETFVPNMFYLDGSWNIREEYAESATTGSKVIYRYSGDKVFMVASAPAGARVQIFQDGKPVGEAAGADVDADGYVTVQEEGLYKLIDNPDGAGQHVLELRIEDAGFNLFTYTFG